MRKANKKVTNNTKPINTYCLGITKEFVSAAGDSVPQFKVGLVDGSFQDTEALKKLSALPGKDALLGQLLGALMSPSYGLVGTLNANMQKLLFVLTSKAG